MRIGYVRVSSIDQNEQRQLAALETFHVERIFVDRASGRDLERPELKKLLEFIREGDELIVVSMDRLARNLSDLLQLVDALTEKGIGIRFLKENLAFEPKGSASPMAKLMLSMIGAFAEFERSLIRERQREGIELAKMRGVYKGRKPIAEEKMEEALKLVSIGVSKTTAANRVGISRSALIRWLKLRHPKLLARPPRIKK